MEKDPLIFMCHSEPRSAGGHSARLDFTKMKAYGHVTMTEIVLRGFPVEGSVHINDRAPSSEEYVLLPPTIHEEDGGFWDLFDEVHERISRFHLNWGLETGIPNHREMERAPVRNRGLARETTGRSRKPAQVIEFSVS